MKLTLMEELLLLALHDEKGKIISSSSTALPFGLTGAALLELATQGKIDVEARKLMVIDRTPTGDRIVDQALEIVDRGTKPKSVKYWVTKLRSQMKGLRNDLLLQLILKGVLTKTDGKILWVIPTKVYPTRNPEPENEVRTRVRSVVLGDGRPDERSSLLISLIKSCNLTNEVFAKEDRKLAKKRINEIAKGERIGKAVADTVNEAVMVAVMGAVVASTAASTASSSSC